MLSRVSRLTALLPPLALAACGHSSRTHAGHAGASGGSAILFSNLGTYHHPVTTRVPEAQSFFDQGLRLVYGFNHEEAIRSFREAARLDPGCAMAHWGAALALGPHINNPTIDAAASRAAFDELQKAKAASAGATEAERAYVDALARRYEDPPPPDRKPLDEAYANAMRQLARRYPDDVDAATLFAESLMDLHPWDLWEKEGQPKAWTPEIVSTLEAVLAKRPDHPGANHYYIHAVEASPHPEKAVASADRLAGGLVPGAGHLVHMPGHVYYRVGRYEDAAEANRRAIEVDRAYAKQAAAAGFYTMYKAHNFQFLWAAAMMSGRSAEAAQAARDALAQIPPPMVEEMADMMDFAFAMPIEALVRFGRWDEVLAEPPPGRKLKLTPALRHYARGMAFAAKGQLGDALKEEDALKSAAAEVSEKSMVGLNPARTVVGIATDVLAGEIAYRQRKTPEAVRHLEAAVRAEDGLGYDEPPDWYQPVRQLLGAVLLEAGRVREAEAVYREDLRRNPENGWSLFGLAQVLRARGQDKEAAEVEARFHKAWAHADVTLHASRF